MLEIIFIITITVELDASIYYYIVSSSCHFYLMFLVNELIVMMEGNVLQNFYIYIYVCRQTAALS